MLALQTPDWLHTGLPSPQVAEGIAGRAVPAPVTLRTGGAAGKEEAGEADQIDKQPVYISSTPFMALLLGSAIMCKNDFPGIANIKGTCASQITEWES